MNIYLSPFAAENLVSRDGFGRPLPRQPAHYPQSGLIWCVLTEFLPFSAAASICLYRHTPSGQSRVYRVTQWRTDGVHSRESAGAGQVVLKVVPVTGAAFAGLTMGQLMYASRFPHPLLIVVPGMECSCCVIQKVPCRKREERRTKHKNDTGSGYRSARTPKGEAKTHTL